jgi:hypothetical protein
MAFSAHSWATSRSLWRSALRTSAALERTPSGKRHSHDAQRHQHLHQRKALQCTASPIVQMTVMIVQIHGFGAAAPSSGCTENGCTPSVITSRL